MTRILRNTFVVLTCMLGLPACGGSPSGPTPIPTPTPTTTIGGRISSGRDGTSIVNATVEVVSPVIDAGLRTMTDSEGRYRIPGIRSETFIVRYSHPEYTTRHGEFTVVLGHEPTNLDIILVPIGPPPPQTTIEGRAFNKYNALFVSNVTVEVLNTDPVLRTTTDSEGRYRISGIRSATFTLRYSHPEYQTLEREYSFRVGSNAGINFELTPVGPTPITTIGGRVSGDCGGRVCLIVGAEVIVLNPDGTHSSLLTTTDSEGRYRLSGIQSREFTVRYRHPNFQATNIGYRINIGNTSLNLDVQLGARQ